MVIPVFQSHKETNDLLKTLYDYIKEVGESYILKEKFDSFSELAYLYSTNLKPISNTYEYYCNKNLDDKAHVALVQMIGSLCYIQSFILGRSRK